MLFSETMPVTIWHLGMTIFEGPKLLYDDGSRSSVERLFYQFFNS